MSIVKISIVIPPNEEMTIGTIISAQRPVEVRTSKRKYGCGSRHIRQSLTLRCPAFIVAWRISLIVKALKLRTIAQDKYTLHRRKLKIIKLN